jgi:NTP pyrophosphatase (non-canonical NTP hydrolase)
MTNELNMREESKGSLQTAVYTAVESRGYMKGWTAFQALHRQLAKLAEELAEVVEASDFMPTDGFALLAVEAGQSARRVFDLNKPHQLPWAEFADIPPALQVEAAARMSKELADMQVVLLCAAELVGKVLAEAGVEDSHFDVLAAASRKATGDIDRGVRQTHWGDPCRYCGVPHDEVAVGDCPGGAGEGGAGSQ